jgi:hypothetical protein
MNTELCGSIRITTPKGDIELGVTTAACRKRPFLFIMRGANMDILAYFRNDEDAITFRKALGSIVEAWEASRLHTESERNEQ